MAEEGVPFTFRVPTSVGWERFSSIPTDKSAGGPISLNRSIVGPQGAEAIIFWTSFPDGDYADPCARLLSQKVGSSAAELVTGPSNAWGDTIKVWIVDVDGTRLFIEAETTKQAVGGLKQEAEQIVGSIRFESPIGIDWSGGRRLQAAIGMFRFNEPDS